RWEESLEPVIATEDLECGLGSIPAGHAAGVRQVAVGHGPEGALVRLVFQAAIGQRDPHDRVRLDGEPPLDLRIQGGVHGDVATSAVLLNAIPALLEAQPGLHTMVSIRPPRCGPAA
ncbi:MAG: dihydrodipicolinate reductase, partial [Planctomycetota bacterium]